jgi:hypothetical protein
MIAENGMNAERRLQPGKRLRPLARGDIAGPQAQTGNIIAEQNDHIRAKLVGFIDNMADALGVHPGLAGVQVGHHGDAEFELRRPSSRPQIVTRDLQPQQRLDDERIGRRGRPGGPGQSQQFEKVPAGNHAIGILGSVAVNAAAHVKKSLQTEMETELFTLRASNHLCMGTEDTIIATARPCPSTLPSSGRRMI